jgi:hypothetical protein
VTLAFLGNLVLQIAQADYKTAVLLYEEADTLKPLGLLKFDILAIALLKSPTAGVMQAVMRLREKSGCSRHPYLQVLDWLGKMQQCYLWC